MCYDISFTTSVENIADYLPEIEPDIEQLALNFEPTEHVLAHSFRKHPVIVFENGAYRLKLFEWGVIADYMNTPEKIREYRMAMANARSEKIIADKRSVWHRIRKNRCLVFTTGFFEHHDAGLKKKIPFFVHLKDEPVFCFAGLYNYSPLPDPETGEAIGTFAVVTRPANELMTKIHNSGPNSHRMPLILTKELGKKWLDNNLPDAELQAILEYECPPDLMQAWPVNTIRTRKVDDENVIKAVPGELNLF